MKAITAGLAWLASLAVCQAQTRDYPVKPVPFTAVHVTDGFWAPRIEINRTVTIPFAFQKDEETGRLDNFIHAAQALRGESFENHKPPGYPFDDTDVYKVIEGASYSLSVHPDPKLEAYVDGLIARIAAAQEPDGYLYTARTFDPLHPHPWAGPQRWMLESVNSHELYDRGICTKPPRRTTWRPASERCWTSRCAPPTCWWPPSVPASRRSGRGIR